MSYKKYKFNAILNQINRFSKDIQGLATEFNYLQGLINVFGPTSPVPVVKIALIFGMGISKKIHIQSLEERWN